MVHLIAYFYPHDRLQFTKQITPELDTGLAVVMVIPQLNGNIQCSEIRRSSLPTVSGFGVRGGVVSVVDQLQAAAL